MYIDVKSTIWSRLKYENDEHLQELIKEAKEGAEYLIDDAYGFEESEHLLETDIFMDVLANEGNPTIEIYNDDGELIWDNSIKNINNEITN